jgi:hypothetical protein
MSAPSGMCETRSARLRAALLLPQTVSGVAFPRPLAYNAAVVRD